MYAPIILPADLASVMYPEIQEEITRGDNTLAQEAINAAISEAKMYLSKYDLTALFGSEADDAPSTFSDPMLLKMIKDIARWNLIQLANINIDYKAAMDLKDMAVKTLTNIQKGAADPKWPYNDPTGETAPPSDAVTIITNDARNNHY